MTLNLYFFQRETESGETITIKLEKENDESEQRYLKVANIKVASKRTNIDQNSAIPAQVIANKHTSNDMNEDEIAQIKDENTKLRTALQALLVSDERTKEKLESFKNLAAKKDVEIATLRNGLMKTNDSEKQAKQDLAIKEAKSREPVKESTELAIKKDGDVVLF